MGGPIIFPDLKRTGRKVDLLDHFVDNFEAKANRLFLKELHHFRPHDSIGKAGIVFHIGRRG